MWRNLLASTEPAAAAAPTIAVINAPNNLPTGQKLPGQPAFAGVGYSYDQDLCLYWLNAALRTTVSVDLTVYCIDWLHKDWDLETFVAIEGPKVLHAYNYDPQSYEADAEFVQQYLRLVCIESGASLAFNVSDWKQFLLAELNKAPKQPADVVTRIVVPSGWDSKAKILATREDFPVDTPWREIKLPQPRSIDIPDISDSVEPIEMSKVLAAIKGETNEAQDLNKVFSYLMDKATS